MDKNVIKVDPGAGDIVRRFAITVDGKPKYPAILPIVSPAGASNVVDLAAYRRHVRKPQ
jgi:hypothetical protein